MKSGLKRALRLVALPLAAATFWLVVAGPVPAVAADQNFATTVQPVLTFGVTGYNSGSCNGATINATASSAASVPLVASSAVNSIGGQTLSVTTNSGNGYTTYVKTGGAANDGNGHTVPAWTGQMPSPPLSRRLALHILATRLTTHSAVLPLAFRRINGQASPTTERRS